MEGGVKSIGPPVVGKTVQATESDFLDACCTDTIRSLEAPTKVALLPLEVMAAITLRMVGFLIDENGVETFGNEDLVVFLQQGLNLH